MSWRGSLIDRVDYAYVDGARGIVPIGSGHQGLVVTKYQAAGQRVAVIWWAIFQFLVTVAYSAEAILCISARAISFRRVLPRACPASSSALLIRCQPSSPIGCVPRPSSSETRSSR